MTDLPHHEGLVGLLRHLGDSSFVPPGLYFLNLGHPNQLFYFAAWPLSYLFGTDTACRLIVALSQLGIMVFAGRLARHLGRFTWPALLVAPLALGWIFFWGLVTNLLGIAVLLAVLPPLDRYANAPTGRRAASMAGVVVLLYFAHESAMMIGLVASLVFALGHPLRGRQAALRFFPVVFGVGLSLAQKVFQAHLFTATQSLATTYGTPWAKLIGIPNVLVGSHDASAKYMLAGLAFGGMLAFAMDRRRGESSGEEGSSSLAEEPRERGFTPFVHHFRFELFGALMFTAYLLVPHGFHGVTMLNGRFFGPAYAVLAVSSAPKIGERVGLVARALAVALPISVLLLVWPQFIDSDRCYRDLDVILARIGKGASVALVEMGMPVARPVRVFSASAGGARALAVKGGRGLYPFVRSPIAPVMQSKAYLWDEVDTRLIDTMSFRPSYDLHRFRYVIMHSQDPKILMAGSLAMLPEARVVESAGERVLMESTLEQVPLLSGNGAPPLASDKTMHKRVTDLIKGLQTAPKASAEKLTPAAP